MKKYQTFLIIILAFLGILSACKSDFLDIKPKGSLSQDVLATSDGVNAMLVGAYSLLDGVSSQFGWESASSNWVWASIRGLEANKGTDAGDQPDIESIMNFVETPTNSYLNVKWREVYEAISRCNNTINTANMAVKNGSLTQDDANLIIQQATALRGWYHFEGWRMWKTIPYMDEKADPKTVTNAADISDKILADLTVGTTLPNNMGQIGRFNGTVCKVLLAKAMMQMKGDYAGALPLLQAALTGTKPNGAAIGLAPTYGEIFDITNRNGIEAIYTVQYSVNDGSGGYNGGYGEVLNFPYKSGSSPGGCCGFFDPTQEFVNSFRTVGGLPLLDFTYNNLPVKNDEGLTPAQAFVPDAGELDPRLDWSVGRRGIPYWDWGKHTGADWIRDQSYSGPYSPKKQVYKKSQEGSYTEVGNWTSGYTENGYRMIRYADVVLLVAECQIETGDLAGARTNVNLIRARAQNPAGFVMDGAVPAADYVINQYAAAGYPFDNQANARLALRMERKLELGMEGHRWFDLNRWGITSTELTRALTYEKTMPWGGLLYNNAPASLPANVDIYPIPQRQIDISNGTLVQVK
jgi:starch-binding outer membrane protein, SusD/RagB family